MPTTTSLLKKLSTTFSSRRPPSQEAAPARGGTTDSGGTRKLSLRILLLLIFAVALSPVLVIGGLRWSSDIERETQRRREMMSLVAEQAADRAEGILTVAPALLNVIDTLLASDPCSPQLTKLIDDLPQ
jgi:hypothetical protein